MTAATLPVVTFLEPDYMYGIGPITLRVQRIDRAVATRYLGENWFPVDGIELTGTGTELGRRRIHVRAARLPS